MAALIMVRPGRDWQSSGGLFDWTLEYLIPRLSDKETADWLRTVVEQNLGSIWIPDLPPHTQDQIYDLLRTEILAAARRELPAEAQDQIQELVDLTYPD
jgi:hypothetical protein